MWKWETESEAKGVIVIAHNILEHTGRYAYLITMLRRQGYHVIMGDLPGQGQTSRANKGQIESCERVQVTYISPRRGSRRTYRAQFIGKD